MAREADPSAPPARSAEAILRRHFGHRRDIRSGSAVVAVAARHLATGFAELDRALPGNGWPLGAVTEILGDGPGALWILLPALSRLDSAIVMIAPPHVPYAPALQQHGVDPARILLVRPRRQADGCWAAEEALRAAAGSVLFWLDQASDRTLRRLQLAAAEGDVFGACFRPGRHLGQRSAAALRVRVTPVSTGVEVDLVKVRGGHPVSGIVLSTGDSDR